MVSEHIAAEKGKIRDILQDDPIIGLGKSPESNIIQRSRPLQMLIGCGFNLIEYKFIDIFLSRIDSHHPERKTVIFSKDDLDALLGDDIYTESDIEKIMMDLSQKSVIFPDFEFVEVKDSRCSIGVKKKAVIHWDKPVYLSIFEKIMPDYDRSGIFRITLQCTESFAQYVFHIDTLGYIKYQLNDIIALRSVYAYALFIYIESNRYRGQWEVTVDQLRRELNCTDRTYDQFKYFNRRILKKYQAELRQVSRCYFKYETIKKGCTVKKILFMTRRKRIDTEIFPKDVPEGPASGLPEAWTLPFNNQDGKCEFTEKQMEVLKGLLYSIPDGILPLGPAEAENDINLRRYNYMARNVAIMNAYIPIQPL